MFERKRNQITTQVRKNMKYFTFLYPVKSALSINVRVCSNNLLRPTTQINKIFCFITSEQQSNTNLEDKQAISLQTP